MWRAERRPTALWRSLLALSLLSALGCGELPSQEDAAELPQTRTAALRPSEVQALTQIPVRDTPNAGCEPRGRRSGRVPERSVPFETNYLIDVVHCEMPPGDNIPLEAFKAQAIAARGYALFRLQDEHAGAMCSSEVDQHYNCGRSPSAARRQRIEQAVQETAGLISVRGEHVNVSFYVAGLIPSADSCIPTAAEIARATKSARDNEALVTHRNSAGVGSSLGSGANPHNMGAMSQNGATCLARRGADHLAILRFYYGDLLTLYNVNTGASGASATPSDPLAPVGPVPLPRPRPQTPDPHNPPSGSSCSSADSAPTILSRDRWGAARATGSRPAHIPNRITIHHTASTATANGAADVKGVQTYHMGPERNYSDIAYHYLIDRDGVIYEGTPEGFIGAHVGGDNTGNLGISFIGNLDTSPFPSAQKLAGARLIRHLARKHNISVDRSLIKGHKERPNASTVCPGRNVSVDELVQLAQASSLCTPNTDDGTGNGTGDNPFTYETPNLEVVPEGLQGYRYLRMTHTGTSAEPFFIDTVFQLRGATRLYAKSASGGSNSGASIGEGDVTKCSELASKAASLNGGGAITYEFAEGTYDSRFFISAFKTDPLPDARSCQYTFAARVKVETSVDGETWETISESMASNSGADIPSGAFEFLVPSGDTAPRTATFKMRASPEIVKVEYYAEQYPIGAGEDRGNNYQHEYRFEGVGRRLISAWGYNAAGQLVASAQKYVTIGDGLSFITPREGGTYQRDISLEVAAHDETETVIFEVGGVEIARVSGDAGHFMASHRFALGEHRLTARGLDANGRTIDEQTINILISDLASGLYFISPKAGGAYHGTLNMLVEASNPRIVSVEYDADDTTPLGDSGDRATQFAISAMVSPLGRRKLTATGFDAEGQPIANATIYVTLTDANGTVPPGSDDTPLGATPGGADACDQDDSRAARLSAEAKRLLGKNGQGPQTGGGQCWQFVKSAIRREGHVNPYAVGLSGPCASNDFQGSAYCLYRNAIANPQQLRDRYGMEILQVSPRQAPEGALIGWDQGCNGFDATHGHAEISVGGGRACSDFCGNIKAGGESCSAVFMPINAMACVNAPVPSPRPDPRPTPAPPTDPSWTSTPPVSQLVASTCTTESVKGLSLQLLEEMNCLDPGRMEGLTGIQGLSFTSATFPYLQAPAAQSLRRVMSGGGSMQLTSALRTIPQQYLLWRWGQRSTCRIGLAAPPGSSNHNGGLAIDTGDHGAMRARLEGQGWRWFGGNDPVHFDHTAGGRDVRALSVEAFQRLWNRNNPNDLIDEDGIYGNDTQSRVERSPSGGFRQGASCGASLRSLVTTPDSLDTLDLSASLTPAGEGVWRAEVIAPREVWMVSWSLDDEIIATVSRDDAGDGALITPLELPSHAALEVVAFDQEGRTLGRSPARVSPDHLITPLGLGRYTISARALDPGARGLAVTLDGLPPAELSEQPLSQHPFTWRISLRGQVEALERLHLTPAR